LEKPIESLISMLLMIAFVKLDRLPKQIAETCSGVGGSPRCPEFKL
jgi:hypothetical protein